MTSQTAQKAVNETNRGGVIGYSTVIELRVLLKSATKKNKTINDRNEPSSGQAEISQLCSRENGEPNPVKI